MLSQQERPTNRRKDVPVELLGLDVPNQEWLAIINDRPNVLVEGSEGGTERVIRAVTAAVAGPSYDWGHTEQALGATLIVRRIDLLSPDEHRRLLDFLNAEHARVRVRQVITTSERPLYALVESGLFLTELYYRLNTIRLELNEAA
jgi:hypothetical protein